MSEEELKKDSPQTTWQIYKDLAEREATLSRPIITKDTLIPLGMIGIFVSVAWFASAINSEVAASKIRIDKLEQALSTLNEIKVDMSALSAKLDVIQKTIKGG